MMDWADVIAQDKIYDLWMHESDGYGGRCFTECYPDELAKLLRKARADGMREAAKMMHNDTFQDWDEDEGFVFLFDKYRQALSARAAEIEKGNA